MIKLIKILVNLFFPPKCIFCRKMLDVTSDDYMCHMCRRNLPYSASHNTCCICGQKIGSNSEKCSVCRVEGRKFDRHITVFDYTGYIKESINRFKFKKMPFYSEGYADLMSILINMYYSNITFDYIVSAPISAKRLKERGYDQTMLISLKLEKLLKISYLNNCLGKIVDTPKQSSLSEENRKTNLIGSIKTIKADKVAGSTILLIDDVATTCSTLDICAEKLKESGVLKVYCATVASPVKGNDSN